MEYLQGYRAVIDTVARLFAALDSHECGRLIADAAGARFDEFNEQRVRVYGYLAMLAPQSLMDAQDNLIDHLLQIAHGRDTYEWGRSERKRYVCFMLSVTTSILIKALYRITVSSEMNRC